MSGGELKDRGAGVHTLCADCNSLTGGQYVPELKEWTGRGMSIVLQATKEGQPPGNAVECTLKKVRPALFLKQLVAMLASVNQPTLLDDHPELRRFVLEREAMGLPSIDSFRSSRGQPVTGWRTARGQLRDRRFVVTNRRISVSPRRTI